MSAKKVMTLSMKIQETGYSTENSLITRSRLEMRVEALYRLSDKNGFSIWRKEFRYAEMMGDPGFAAFSRKFAVESRTYPDLSLEIVVTGIHTERPFDLELLNPDKPLPRQEIAEYDRIAKLVDGLNAEDQMAQAPKSTADKRVKPNQKDKQSRQSRVKQYCETGTKTIAEMAECENVSEATINRDIAELRRAGQIVR